MSDINVTDSGSGSSAPSGATSQAPAASATATPPAAPVSTPTSGIPEGMVPSYRLRETRESATREATAAAQAQWAQKESEFNARYAEMERRVQALAGIAPPPDPNVSAVRNQFGQLYQGLAKLDSRADDLLAMADRMGDVEAQNSHYWQTYGKQSVDRLFDQVSKSIGAPLNDESKRVLHSSFVGFVTSSPEMTARYQNDPTIVEDFVRTFTSNFIDPARRVASAGVQDRAQVNLPRDTAGGVPRATPAPSTAGQSLDDRTAAAWSQFQHLTQK